MRDRTVFTAAIMFRLCLAAATPAAGDDPAGARRPDRVNLPDAKPVPRMQVIPLPDHQAAILRDGRELTRYHFGPTLRRPFLYPVVGPSGRSLTRMGHPHDPESHSHHNSVWVAHNDVGGESFWDDRSPGRIVHRRIQRYADGDDEASIVAENAWVGRDDRVLLRERRGIAVRPLPEGQWLLLLDLHLEAASGPVTLGATPFGPIGVRMAKTIGGDDGGGLIRNSEGNVNETGPNGAFRRRARWVDYSGPITSDAAEGITLLDHPSNPHHPVPFHVRTDGWMGASLTLTDPITIAPGRPLWLRYGLFVHAGVPSPEVINALWAEFARTTLEDLPTK
jgi:Methane oxygenase PmoA